MRDRRLELEQVGPILWIIARPFDVLPRETANRIAKDACSRAVVQFLDGTVAFAGFRLSRGAHGGRRLLRTYTFDYTSDGFERAQGFIVLAGLKLEAVGLAGSPS